MLFEKLNVRIKEIGEKYKEPPERPAQVQVPRPSEREFRRGDMGRQRDKKNDWKKIKRRKFGKRRR
jgi:nucleolar protein 56